MESLQTVRRRALLARPFHVAISSLLHDSGERVDELAQVGRSGWEEEDVRVLIISHCQRLADFNLDDKIGWVSKELDVAP